LSVRPIYFRLRRIFSLFGRFISLFDRLGNLLRSLQKHQWLGRVDAVLEGPKIEVFPVFSRRAGKRQPAPAMAAFLRVSS
jgi:hypothetical protein